MKKLTFNIFKIFFLAVFALSACKKDNDNLTKNEPSHRVIFTSEMDFENTIEVDNKISFGDVSAGVESRTWTFPDGVVDILDSDNDQTSTEGNVHTIWTKAGIYDVHLTQTFKSDAYVDNTLAGKTLDTTIVITVLEPVEVAVEAHYINPDGTVGDALDVSANALNEIPAARTVRFTWTGIGEPRWISWDFERAGPNTYAGMERTVDVRYKFLGEFDLWIAGTRSRPFGGDTLFLENFIKVVPSTDPVLLEELTEKDGKIACVFGRELEHSSVDPADFSIKVEHDGNLITDQFVSASVDPDEGNIVLLDLGSESIYNDDVISVSFTNGNLISLDGVLATEFTDELLVFRQKNLLEGTDFDFSFENTFSTDWQPVGWAPPFDKGTWEISTAQAFDGNSSLYIEVEPGDGAVFRQVDVSMNFPSFSANATRQYEIGAWSYVEQLGNTDPASLNQPDLRFYWLPNFPAAEPNPAYADTFPEGEWVFSSEFREFDETTDHHFQLRVSNIPNGETLKLYIDKIVMYEVELRP